MMDATTRALIEAALAFDGTSSRWDALTFCKNHYRAAHPNGPEESPTTQDPQRSRDRLALMCAYIQGRGTPYELPKHVAIDAAKCADAALSALEEPAR